MLPNSAGTTEHDETATSHDETQGDHMATTSQQHRLDIRRFRMWIGGEERDARGGRVLDSVDPTTGATWSQIPDADSADVADAVGAARRAFDEQWRALSPTRRGRHLLRLAEILGDAAEELATLETRENGKLLKEMLAQARTAPDYLTYWAGMADKVEGRVVPLDGKDALNYTLREPLGVVGIVTPWNSPLLIAIQGLGPALAAGNTVVIKPSEIASAGVVRLAELTGDAGLPPGVVNVVTGGAETGRALVEHPDVAKVVFTGGVETGRAVARTAADRGATTLLELGGKSPNIVFPDADLDAAEAGLLAGIYAAAGQTCIAGSRALLHEDLYDELIKRLQTRAESVVVGNPREPSTQMGPIATRSQLAKVESFVDEATRDGARIVAGGRPADVDGLPDGFFYRPTIVDGAARDSELLQEEVFGPVLAVVPFSTEREAIEIANGTRYGLAAGVWTRDVKRAHRVARSIDAGIVWINTYRAGSFNSPFGGMRASGVGRENSVDTIYEFLQTKSVWCELDETVRDPFVIRL
ncbi:MAG: aldehyde dehydrogenase [Thermoleophilaceae bacterium]